MITPEEIMSSEVRALSWKQPYAQLMLSGKIETRTWPTNYRGLVLICASKQRYTGAQTGEVSGAVQLQRLIDILTFNEFSIGLINGHAIAIGRLVDCRPMTAADEDATYVKYKAPWTTTTIGKFKQVRIIQKQLWCHIYEDVTPIEPFKWNGVQGWKTIKGDWAKSFIIPVAGKLKAIKAIF